MEHPPAATVVYDDGGVVLGSAKMGPNRPARGAHVGTASFMVAPEARGRAFVGALTVVLLLGLCAVSLPVVLARSSAIRGVVGVPVALTAITAGVGALYRFSVGTRLGARAVFPGALTSALGVVIVTAGFGTYVDRSTKYTAVYGAFAGAVIGMLAIYFAVYVVLLGAVLNRQLGAALRRRSDRRPDVVLTKGEPK